MAEKHQDWNLTSWDEFVCNEEGNYAAFELFFQMRLHLSNRYREITIDQKEQSLDHYPYCRNIPQFMPMARF